MQGLRQSAKVLLLIGDIGVLYLAVWVTLCVRYLGLPPANVAQAHLSAFSFLFIVWFVVYIIAGLYSRYTLVFRHRLPSIVLSAQTVNVTLAALFFFTIPLFGIAPKTILVLYLGVSTILLYAWRVYIFPHVGSARQLGAIVLGTGDDVIDLVSSVNHDPHHPLHFHAIIHPEMVSEEEIIRTVNLLLEGGAVSAIVVDTHNTSVAELLPYIHDITLVKQQALFLEFDAVYADVFEKVPLSCMSEAWLLQHVSAAATRPYRYIKRAMDIVAGIALLLIAACISPVVWLAMRLEGKGPFLITQQRIGRHGNSITIRKIRSMMYSDDGAWIGDTPNTVTRVGKILRASHLDEFPQGWNLVTGSLSLVGPRPDIVGLYASLVETIPLYAIRYAVTPGLSGWAQTSQIYRKGTNSPQSLEDTRERLSYDLYYLTRKSLLLDMRIITRTIGRLVSVV